MLAPADLKLMQLLTRAMGKKKQTELNPITIVFAGINDHFAWQRSSEQTQTDLHS